MGELEEEHRNGGAAGVCTKLAAFRKAHPVIRKAEPMHLNDYQHKGCPDLSYHSDNAWAAGLPEEKGAFGVMYCGDYAVNDAGEPDDMVYIGYNFHTGVNELALPKLAGKKKWYVVMDTAEQEHAFLPEENWRKTSTGSRSDRSLSFYYLENRKSGK